MNGHEQLLEWARRRTLTEREADRLRELAASDPDFATECEEEQALTRLLQRLPDAPVASNFTAQVLQAVQEQTAGSHRSRISWPAWIRRGTSGWSSRWAYAGLLALAGGWMVYFQHENSLRVERAESVAALAPVVNVPSVEVLQDFEAIRRLRFVPDWTADLAGRTDSQALSVTQSPDIDAPARSAMAVSESEFELLLTALP